MSYKIADTSARAFQVRYRRHFAGGKSVRDSFRVESCTPHLREILKLVAEGQETKETAEGLAKHYSTIGTIWRKACREMSKSKI
jgi:DNA-binding NarL/FixJ family response regulator